MTNIIPTNMQVPAHLADKIGKGSALTESLGAGIGGGADFPRISIKGSRFRIIEDGVETVLDTTVLDAVIVGANPRLSKTFYAAEWNPDSEPSAPDCFSLDGIRPHPDSTAPQNDLCASCPNNAWGSKITPNGQKVKACADQKRLAIVAADDPEGAAYLLAVTPSALKGLNAYHKELTMRGIPAELVRTRISFDTDASFPKLKFGFGGFIDEDTYETVEKLFGSDEVLAITGEKDPATAVAEAAPAEEEAPKPKRKPRAKAKPAPEPEAEPDAAEEEAPAPKRGFGKKAAAAPAEEKPKRRTRAKAKAEPEATTVSSVDDLASEIEALIGDDDD